MRTRRHLRCRGCRNRPGPEPRPELLAITGASNITGWLPPPEAIIAAAHRRDVLVVVDGAQLAPHRRLPADADFIAFSGHKMYAPFGAGVLVGPRRVFSDGDPFLAGGGAVDLVDLDEVVWTDPPDREEAGSPNIIGAVALHAAIDTFGELGWPALVEHDDRFAQMLRSGLASVPGVRLLGPGLEIETLPVATFRSSRASPTLSLLHGCPLRTRLASATAASVLTPT